MSTAVFHPTPFLRWSLASVCSSVSSLEVSSLPPHCSSNKSNSNNRTHHYSGDSNKGSRRADPLPLILIHGHTSSKETFIPVGKRLSERLQTDVIAVDLRGHGESPLPQPIRLSCSSRTQNAIKDYYDGDADNEDTSTLTDEDMKNETLFTDYRPSAMANDLFQFLDRHSIPRVNVLGHSMGAIVATCFAAKYPERVGKLVLEDMDIRIRPVGRRQKRVEVESLRQFPQQYVGKTAAISAAVSLGYPLERVLYWVQTSRIFKLPRDARKSDEEAVWHLSIHPYTTYHCLHQIGSTDAMEKAWITVSSQHMIQNNGIEHRSNHDKKDCSCSPPFLLLLVAQEDSVVEGRTLERMQRINPRMEVQRISSSKHSIHHTNTPAFLDAVVGFLQ